MTDEKISILPIPEPTPEEIERVEIANALTGIRQLPELQKYADQIQTKAEGLRNKYWDCVRNKFQGLLTVDKLVNKGFDQNESETIVAEFEELNG